MPNYESPDFPVSRPGRPSMQAASEALERQRLHDEWHEEHPNDFNCPPALSPPGDYEAIERGMDVFALGGGDIEPGDGFVFGKGGK